MHSNKTYTQSLIMDFHVGFNNPIPRLIFGFLIYLFLASLFLNTSTTTLVESCMEQERQALLSFKEGLIDPSGRLSSWVGDQCCEWRGVSCNNRTGHVVNLDLRNQHTYPEYDLGLWSYTEYEQSRLHGKSIDPSLLGLKHLSYLDLSNNDFQEIKIPSFMGQLTGLSYLNLSNSHFDGEIPHSLGNLSNLNNLDLSSNFIFSKTLNWSSHLFSLKYLNLRAVDLSSIGRGSWLYALNKLPSLQELHLSNCQFQNIPQLLQFPFNFTSLEVLDISENYLPNSSFPKWIFNLSSLTKLDLSFNSFGDSFLDKIATLKSLEYLDYSGTGLKGQLPNFNGHFCNLKSLQLAANSFDGGLEEFLNGLSNCSSNTMEMLDLSSNELEGELPSSLGKLKSLQFLDLRYNFFYGPLPESLGQLSNLVNLDLSENHFNGSLPESMGQLSQLVALDLSSNLWEGNLTEVHFINLTRLETFSFMVTPHEEGLMRASIEDRKVSVFVNVIDKEWIPPFKLRVLHISSCRVGPRFPKWLQSQTDLIELVLQNVGISSPIPDQWLSKMSSRIELLDLSHNQITGKLPFKFIFPNLQEIYLQHNQFDGPLELSSTNAPVLLILTISDNHLSGTIPSSICTIQSLLALDLSNNHLSGEFPQEWGIWRNIRVVVVSNNSLSGNIPTSMGIPNSLTVLKMNNNHFSGKIPSSLQNCSNLRKLYLGGNNFNGTIPSWIGSTTLLLERLILRSNFFSGHIPRALCNLSQLRLLDFGHNNLSGTIPKCLINLTSLVLGQQNFGKTIDGDYGPTTVNVKGGEWEYDDYAVQDLTIIDFSGNNLEGDIPQEICGILGLNTLNLSMNQLSGNIPSKIGNLYMLETLDLSHNHLSGHLPQSLSNMTFLSHLNLSYNNLTGRIPSGPQLQTLDDESIYEGNPSLCGFPLPKCLEDTKHEPRVQEKKNHDDDDDEDKLGFYTSATLGFIIGFWSVCGTLMLNKSLRYAYFRFFDNIKEKIALAIALKVARFQRRN